MRTPGDYQTDSPSEIQRIHHEEKSNHQQQAHLLSHAKYRLPGSNIPVEPAFIQVGVRKHDIALAIDDIALPFLLAHGAK